MENLTTSTTETTPTEVQYAGFWLRVVACLIDTLIIKIVFAVIFSPLFVFMGLSSFVNYDADVNKMDRSETIPNELFPYITAITIGAMLLGIFCLLIIGLYYALMESSSKQATLGKMILNLKVTDLNGGRISFARASGRFFGRFVSSLTLCIGYIIAGLSTKKQALHDMMSNCLVVKN